MDNIVQLMLIQPFDDIDAACRRHDICYSVAGYFNSGCDFWLGSEIHSMNFTHLPRNQRAFCDDLQFGIVSTIKMDQERTSRPTAANSPADAASGIAEPLIRKVGAAISGGIVVSLDALNNFPGSTQTKCNSINSRGGYNPALQNLIFNDALIEIMLYKNLIDYQKAFELRAKLGINNNLSFPQRTGLTTQAFMRKWSNHPVLSGQWKQ